MWVCTLSVVVYGVRGKEVTCFPCFLEALKDLRNTTDSFCRC